MNIHCLLECDTHGVKFLLVDRFYSVRNELYDARSPFIYLVDRILERHCRVWAIKTFSLSLFLSLYASIYINIIMYYVNRRMTINDNKRKILSFFFLCCNERIMIEDLFLRSDGFLY